MKIVEKTKEFGKKHKKAIKGVAMTAVGAACVGGAYLLGVRATTARYDDMFGRAASGDVIGLIHGPTGDSYKMILEKVVEEVVEG